MSKVEKQTIAAALRLAAKPDDSATNTILNSIEETVLYMQRNDPAVYNMDEMIEGLRSDIKQLRRALSTTSEPKPDNSITDPSTMPLEDRE